MANKLSILLAVLVVFSGCDEGAIYPSENLQGQSGMSVRISGRIIGYQQWQNIDGYQLVVAGFGDNTDNLDYAVISKNIPEPDADGNFSVVLSGIPKSEVKALEISVVNRLRVRLATFRKFQDFQASDDTVMIDCKTVDASLYRMVQDNVFAPTCASCHGASGKGARGLFLTDNENFNPVSKPSEAVSGSMVVAPGNHSASVLYRALADNADGALHQPHADMLEAKRRDNLMKIVELWIDNYK